MGGEGEHRHRRRHRHLDGIGASFSLVQAHLLLARPQSREIFLKWDVGNSPLLTQLRLSYFQEDGLGVCLMLHSTDCLLPFLWRLVCAEFHLERLYLVVMGVPVFAALLVSSPSSAFVLESPLLPLSEPAEMDGLFFV